ncbi:LOW QUALITY PROTEIN: coiled-coil domain-containing protein 66 [Pelodytes ibericus]
MNLGDGLKLETQILDGKPRLILASYGVQGKSNKQAGHKSRPQKAVLRTKPAGQILKSVQSNNVKAEAILRKARPETGAVPTAKPPANVLKELENKRISPDIEQNVQPNKQEPGKTKPAVKKPPAPQASKLRPQQKKTISAEELRESLVCLTQEQFQQILLTINHGGQAVSQEPANSEEVADENLSDVVKTEDENISPLNRRPFFISSSLRQSTRPQGDLFSTLGERERDLSLQEAKKAQWRKELDEQIALKKQLRESEDWTSSKHRECSATETQRIPEQTKDTHPDDYSTPSQNSSVPKTSTGTETSNSSPNDLRGLTERPSSFSSPDLPAAIRSAFVLGEAAPVDHPFSAVKRQQQMKWLEELNKQREEVLLRRIQEKKTFLQTEEHDRWAMHFDSFKKQCEHPPTGSLAPSVNFLSSPDVAVPVTMELSPSPAPSYLYQGESRMRKSVEDHSQEQKTGFLRTMTALLDPVQIEERERKRLKQIEHQKAIAAQVEEKRRRKQLEEEERRREEKEEEQRLQQEREKMQRQFEEDSLRQKQKEEMLKMKTNELYQSMLRAQEEAQRLKQEQRMRGLLQKGHDVSKLPRSITGDVQPDHSRAVSRITDLSTEDHGSRTDHVTNRSSPAVISPRKDTAVQTDLLDAEINSYVLRAKETDWRGTQTSSPDIPIEFKNQSKTGGNLKTQKPPRERADSRKENKSTPNDVYDQFARTERDVQENIRKPGWNKNNPNKKFVPASERYPRGLQKQREENKVRRQKELLNLVEKNTMNNIAPKKKHSPEKMPSPREDTKVCPPPQDTKGNQGVKKEEQYQKIDVNYRRSDSPPVPAVKNRLHQAQKRMTADPVYNGNFVHGDINLAKHNHASPESSEQESERPPSSHFIPYVRTKEIYYLDPDAPMSRPSTHDPQYRRPGDDQETRQVFSSDHARDPLLNPNVIRNKDRQQAILRGLSELRKGLLQKQKELETVLMPDV